MPHKSSSSKHSSSHQRESNSHRHRHKERSRSPRSGSEEEDDDGESLGSESPRRSSKSNNNRDRHEKDRHHRDRDSRRDEGHRSKHEFNVADNSKAIHQSNLMRDNIRSSKNAKNGNNQLTRLIQQNKEKREQRAMKRSQKSSRHRDGHHSSRHGKSKHRSSKHEDPDDSQDSDYDPDEDDSEGTADTEDLEFVDDRSESEIERDAQSEEEESDIPSSQEESEEEPHKHRSREHRHKSSKQHRHHQHGHHRSEDKSHNDTTDKDVYTTDDPMDGSTVQEAKTTQGQFDKPENLVQTKINKLEIKRVAIAPETKVSLPAELTEKSSSAMQISPRKESSEFDKPDDANTSAEKSKILKKLEEIAPVSGKTQLDMIREARKEQDKKKKEEKTDGAPQEKKPELNVPEKKTEPVMSEELKKQAAEQEARIKYLEEMIKQMQQNQATSAPALQESTGTKKNDADATKKRKETEETEEATPKKRGRSKAKAKPRLSKQQQLEKKSVISGNIDGSDFEHDDGADESDDNNNEVEDSKMDTEETKKPKARARGKAAASGKRAPRGKRAAKANVASGSDLEDSDKENNLDDKTVKPAPATESNKNAAADEPEKKPVPPMPMVTTKQSKLPLSVTGSILKPSSKQEPISEAKGTEKLPKSSDKESKTTEKDGKDASKEVQSVDKQSKQTVSESKSIGGEAKSIAAETKSTASETKPNDTEAKASVPENVDLTGNMDIDDIDGTENKPSSVLVSTPVNRPTTFSPNNLIGDPAAGVTMEKQFPHIGRSIGESVFNPNSRRYWASLHTLQVYNFSSTVSNWKCYENEVKPATSVRSINSAELLESASTDNSEKNAYILAAPFSFVKSNEAHLVQIFKAERQFLLPPKETNAFVWDLRTEQQDYWKQCPGILVKNNDADMKAATGGMGKIPGNPSDGCVTVRWGMLRKGENRTGNGLIHRLGVANEVLKINGEMNIKYWTLNTQSHLYANCMFYFTDGHPLVEADLRDMTEHLNKLFLSHDLKWPCFTLTKIRFNLQPTV